MYSKQEAKNIRQLFWTSFGQYMKPVPAAGGEKINWINYKTGIPHIRFRMEAEKEYACIAIELANPSAGIREQQFEQLSQFRTILENTVHEKWDWQKNAVDDNGKTISHVYTKQQGLNIFKETDWPAIISFLKPRLIALDAFWEEVKYVFQ